MIAMVDMIKEKPNFRGKYKKKSFCQWLQLPKKTYIIEDDSDSDYDNGELINGNKPVLRIIRRRPGICELYKL